MSGPPGARASRRRLVVATLAACLAATACGTRVPDERFDDLAARGALDEGAGEAEPGTAPGTGDRAAGDRLEGGDTATTGGGPVARAGGARPGEAVTSGLDAPAEAIARNTASDVGVTSDEIVIGIIASKSGPLGADAFMPMWQGVNAYVETVNASGGVHGRRLRLIHCDDAEDPGRNKQCVHELVDRQRVFALVGNATRAYAGADHVAARGVPDVGGQPVGNEYWTHPTFFTIRGAPYRRDGSVGHDGKLYNQTLQFRFMRDRVGTSMAAVVHYNVPVSQSYADFLVRALELEGIEAVPYEVNVAFPNFDAVVADMRDKGVDAIWDVMDPTGNQNLCEAMDRGDLQVKAKVGTTNGWTRAVGRHLPAVCKRSLYAIGESRPSSDTGHPEVRAFRQAMTRVYDGRYDAELHQWALEGWAGARLFSDAVRSMGPAPTRSGLIDWLNAQRDYTGGGLLSPIAWQPVDLALVTAARECLVVARWDDRATDFTAMSEVPLCQPDVPFVAYSPA